MVNELKGTGVALVTPFRKDGGVDEVALRKLVGHVIDGGVEYLVILGTTGESVTLTQEEKQLVKRTIVDQNRGRLPLVLGVGGSNTAQVISELQDVDRKAYQAVLSVSPAYNKPTQEGIYQHFSSVASSTELPILLYNVPGRTASNMLPETVFRLAGDHSNIIGIKEAAGDLQQAMELIHGAPNGFLVISGEDMITLAMVLMGGEGVISVIGQGLPAEFSEMVRLGLRGEAAHARALHYRMMKSISLIFEQGNPAGIKSMLSHLGVCSSEVRLPLVKADPDLHKRIGSFLDEF
ncbi:4-hydroxy-tetrahydrodipicolinate synthase [Aureitalea marina]|uniref:4-hydroxy-tetrahydrodipicolinate synthase n=1 Tax=Aureitalea marina TaxID=930804 RepID=A0A2S7KTI0_9FLAO|nr:4-hydroxy-tetrahydrodipicolinate synthase [Aureitalea marina]